MLTTYILSRPDGKGLQRIERVNEFDQRIAGERRVFFMRGDDCLKEITFDAFLKLIGENKTK